MQKRQRKTMDATPGILFEVWRGILGACEVGKADVIPCDDKHFDDGLVKLPKTLRDMLRSVLAAVNSSQIKCNDLCAVRLLVMGKISLPLSALDSLTYL